MRRIGLDRRTGGLLAALVAALALSAFLALPTAAQDGLCPSGNGSPWEEVADLCTEVVPCAFESLEGPCPVGQLPCVERFGDPIGCATDLVNGNVPSVNACAPGAESVCLNHGGSHNTFGGWAVRREWYGSRVSVRTPSSTYSQGDDEFLLHRSVLQASLDPSSTNGLIQAGIYRSGPSLGIGNCQTSNGSYFRFTEVIGYGTNFYQCQVFASLGALSPGTEVTSDVHRTQFSREWRARINSTLRGTWDLAFNTGSPGIGGEVGDKDAKGFTTSTAAQYGNTMSWDYHRNIDGGNPRKVDITRDRVTNNTPTDGSWQAEQPPTPLTIRRTGGR